MKLRNKIIRKMQLRTIKKPKNRDLEYSIPGADGSTSRKSSNQKEQNNKDGALSSNEVHNLIISI